MGYKAPVSGVSGPDGFGSAGGMDKSGGSFGEGSKGRSSKRRKETLWTMQHHVPSFFSLLKN